MRDRSIRYVNVSRPEVGFTKPISFIPLYYIHIWQVSPQLRI